CERFNAFIYLFYLCHAYSHQMTLLVISLVCLCLQPCIYCNVHTVMFIVNYKFLL
uniref:Uncharacterized protein n=1 Tax=Salvator merianae TaxID=96440 RepID=A0A8D0E175_SALMN